jgi:hypothetical protein
MPRCVCDDAPQTAAERWRENQTSDQQNNGHAGLPQQRYVLHQRNVDSPDPKYDGKHCPCKKCQQQAIDATRFRDTYRLIEFRSASDPDAEDEDEDDKYWE